MPRHRLLVLCPLLAFALAVEAGQDPPPARDLSGDPLPAGAVARLGSLRFRHDAAIIFAAFLPGGRSILSVSSDGVACVWEFPSGKPLRRFETHSAKTPAPVSEEDLVASMPASLRAGLPTRAVALSPDGKTLATSDSAAALQAYALESGFPAKAIKNSGFANKPTEIRLHDVATGKERAGWKVDAATVSDLAFSPDGKHLTVWGNDGFARIWDWAQGKEVGKAATTAKGGTASGAGGLVYSPDGKALLLFRSSRVLQCVEVPTGKALGAQTGNDVPLTAIWFAPDGQQVLTQAGSSPNSPLTAARNTLLGQAASTTRRWEAATGKDLGPATLPAQPGNPTVISLDGRVGVTVATFRAPAEARAAKARPAVVFDTATGKAIGEIGLEVEVAPMHRRPLVFSPDGKFLAVNTGTDKEQIDLYEIPGGKRLRTLDAGPGNQAAKKGILRGAVQKLVFSPDGKMLAFHPGDAAAPIVLLDIATGKQAGSISPDSKSPWAVLLAFTPDGRCLALEMADGTGALLELATGKPRRAYGNKVPTKVAKKGVAFATPAGLTADAGRALAVSSDGKLLALPGPDGTVLVVDVLTGKELTAFKGHTRPVNAVAFSPDGKRLASASADTTALVWDVTPLKRPASPDRTARPEDLDAWWQALADQDAARAFTAMGDFAAVPQQAVAFLKERLRPVPAIEQTRVEKLIAQLDDAQYKVRQKAMRELLDVVDQIAPALDKALAAGPTLEARRRLEDLYNQAASRLLQGERLRAYRAVEVLEQIGIAEARHVLQTLATGAPGARVTASARAALAR
jgi:WD40 repeat protein